MTSIATIDQYDAAKIILSSPNDDLYAPDQKQAFLDAASDYIETLMYQPARLTSQDETFLLGTLYCSLDQNQMINIFPRYFPVGTISSIKYKAAPGTSASQVTITPDQYDVIPGGVGVGPRIVIPFSWWNSPQAFLIFEVIYTSGYAAGAMPKDLVYICCLVAAYFMSAGYAATEINGNTARQVLPDWAWPIVTEVTDRYGRQF